MTTQRGVLVDGRTVARAVLVAILAAFALAGVSTAMPAVAHGGDLKVDLGTDGAGGIDASVTWAGDGHPVEETVDLTVTAVSDDGEEVGPIQLQSASEGVGWYRSEPGVLSEGHWTITATATEPAEYEGETEIDVAAPPSPPAPEPSAEPSVEEVAADGTSGDQAAAAGPDAGDGLSTWAIAGLAVLVAAGGLTAVLLHRRRRAR
ncbi:hypothetical protein UQW22_11580 [Isoptericola halotolerans]|uniref:hypothetical protein n=1 Tax=Isoptericola halotolerans TaxID=300560 RepID=UPI00388D3A64